MTGGDIIQCAPPRPASYPSGDCDDRVGEHPNVDQLARTGPHVASSSVVGIAPGKVLPVTADKQGITTNVCNHKRLLRLRFRPSFQGDGRSFCGAYFATFAASNGSVAWQNAAE